MTWERKLKKDININYKGYGTVDITLLAVPGTGENEATAFLHYEVPRKGDYYPDGRFNSVVEDINLSTMEGFDNTYRITVNYGPGDLDDDSEGEIFPWNKAPDLSVDPRTFDVSLRHDINGRAFRNSAKGPLVDPPVQPVVGLVYSFVQYRRGDASISRSQQYGYKVNENDFSAAGVQIAAGQGLVTGFRVTKMYYDEDGSKTEYYREEISIATNPYGWEVNCLDQGLQHLDNTGKPIPIANNKSKATEPQLLDGAGKMLLKKNGSSYAHEMSSSPRDNVNTNLSSNDAVYLQFEVYEKISFSGLV